MHTAPFLTGLALLVGVLAPALAQHNKPRPPLTNVRSVCQDLDTNIPRVKNETARLYGGLSEPKKEGLSQKEIAGAIEAFEKLALEHEASWQRLGCAAIIYGK